MINEFNFINIDSEIELDTPIYRVYNSQRLLTMFANKENVLVRPSLWDDPLENFILNTAASKMQYHSHLDLEARNYYYGQCWSLIEESDAMWRIYSHDKSGIKVKTTIRKLFSSLKEYVKDNDDNVFIGKVKYLNGDLLREKLMDESWLELEAISYINQATSLMFKRMEFEHEKEVRLLYLNNFHRNTSTDLFHYRIEPNNLFNEIVFDPRISDETFEVYKLYLVEKSGFSKTVRQSELYKIPIL
jgi:hypothetical protein